MLLIRYIQVPLMLVCPLRTCIMVLFYQARFDFGALLNHIVWQAWTFGSSILFLRAFILLLALFLFSLQSVISYACSPVILLV